MTILLIKGSKAEGKVRQRKEKGKIERGITREKAWSPVSQALQRSHYLPGSQQHVGYITY